MMPKCLFFNVSTLRTFIFIFILIITSVFSACIHDKIISSNALEDSGTLRQKRNDWTFEPLKIFIHLDEIDLKISANVLQNIEKGLKGAAQTLSNIFKVKSKNGKFLLQRQSCQKKLDSGMNRGKCAVIKSGPEFCSAQNTDYIIPDRFLDELQAYQEEMSHPYKKYPSGLGVEGYNFLLFVISRSTSWCTQQDVQAYSSYCRVDSLKRPIAGVLNMCPEYFGNKIYPTTHYYNVILHEMFHVLGFSSELYENFKGCSLSKSCTAPKKMYQDVDGIPRIQFTPVIEAMQKHFGCSKSDFGAPIELKNSSDALTSHWHPLLMFSSIMVSSFSENDVLVMDKITLSMLESTGWYEVNYPKQEYFIFGKGKGCDFGTGGKCGTENITELCTVSSKSTSCDVLHQGITHCQDVEPSQSCGVYKPSFKDSCRNQRNSAYGIEFHTLEYPQMCFLTQTNESESKPSCLFVKCKSQNSYEVLHNATWISCDYPKTADDNGIQCIPNMPACFDFKTYDSGRETSSCIKDKNYVISIRMHFNKPSFQEILESADIKTFKINTIHTIAQAIDISPTYLVDATLSLFKQIYLDFSVCPPQSLDNTELGIVIWKTQKFLKSGSFAHVLAGIENSVISSRSIVLHPSVVTAFADHEGFRTLSAIPFICGIFLLATVIASFIRLYLMQKHRPHRTECHSSETSAANESSAERISQQKDSSTAL